MEISKVIDESFHIFENTPKFINKKVLLVCKVIF